MVCFGLTLVVCVWLWFFSKRAKDSNSKFPTLWQSWAYSYFLQYPSRCHPPVHRFAC